MSATEVTDEVQYYKNLLVYAHNAIYYFIKSGDYDGAKFVLSKAVGILDDKDITMEDFASELLMLETDYQEIKWFLEEEDLPTFISNQMSLIKRLSKVKPPDDIDIIEPSIYLAFALIRLNDQYALSVLKHIFSSLNKSGNNSKTSINSFYKIASFLYEESYFKQSNEILINILPRSEEVFGNEHIITNRIRTLYNKNKEHINDESDSSNKLNFSIYLNEEK